MDLTGWEPAERFPPGARVSGRSQSGRRYPLTFSSSPPGELGPRAVSQGAVSRGGDLPGRGGAPGAHEAGN